MRSPHHWDTAAASKFVDEQWTNLGNDQLLGYFLAGIKPEIRVELQRYEESELFAAMDGARRVERKLNFERGLGRGPWKNSWIRGRFEESAQQEPNQI